MKRRLPFVIIAAVLIIVVATGAWLAFRSRKVSKASAGAQPAHARGDQNAPVTLEEFGDFQCPPCGQLYPELKKVESEYGPARVRVVFRQFPLPTMHAHALEAARAAEAADMQGQFWEMHDLLYENQSKWNEARDVRQVFINFAIALGLDAERFARDMESLQASARIAQDEARGRSLGVTGTPTLFINGREVAGDSMTPAGLRAAINAAMQERE